jgi:hypothetical protein
VFRSGLAWLHFGRAGDENGPARGRGGGQKQAVKAGKKARSEEYASAAYAERDISAVYDAATRQRAERDTVGKGSAA